MLRLAVIASLLAFVACGSGDSGKTGGEAPSVSSEGGGAAEAPTIDMGKASQVPSEVTSCLSLVKEAKYKEAIQACLAAADVDPDNNDVSAALEKARNEQAKVMAADAAAGAAGQAQGAAAGAASEATGSATDALGGATGGMKP